jgi:prevent-host-death family protein
MKTVNLHAAKTHLSRLVDAVSGEDIVIAKAGQPLVRLVPVEDDAAKCRQRSFGSWEQKALARRKRPTR